MVFHMMECANFFFHHTVMFRGCFVDFDNRIIGKFFYFREHSIISSKITESKINISTIYNNYFDLCRN